VTVSRDLHDGVDLSNVGEKLIAQPLALVRAADEARDIDEIDRRGNDPVRVDDGVECGEARVRHGDDAHVRLDRAERVVCRFGLRRRERIEERGLADVGQPYDADGETHGTAAPNTRTPKPLDDRRPTPVTAFAAGTPPLLRAFTEMIR
jgi:hypothetical protein